MNSNRALNSFWTLIVPALALFACVFWYVLQSTGGRNQFIYALDDPYIHLSIAKNFAFHGVWGINQHEFTSASSSPLWTALLAVGLRITGTDLQLGSSWPLILNLVFSVCLVWVLSRELLRYFSPIISGIVAVLVLFFTPVPSLIVSGQEHVLHCVVVFLLISGYAHLLTVPAQAFPKKQFNWLLFLTASAGLIRYESLFLFLVFGVVALSQRRIREALLFPIVGTLPVAIFGGISVLQGWPPVPNSIWLKAEPSKNFLALETYTSIVDQYPDVAIFFLIVVGAALWMLFKGRREGEELFTSNLTRRELGFRCALLTGTFLLHLLLARIGWLFRYEAYLLFCSTLVLAPFVSRMSLKAVDKKVAQWGFVWLIAILGFNIILLRSYNTIPKTVTSLQQIRDQQWQMARFFQSNFPDSALALNDIGAVAYLRNSPVTDLVGLANLEVATARRNRRYGKRTIAQITSSRNVEYVAIYPYWFDGNVDSNNVVIGKDSKKSALPDYWVRCAEWHLEKRFFDADVAFYATSAANASKLREAMREFARTLPPQEICTIIEANGQKTRIN